MITTRPCPAFLALTIAMTAAPALAAPFQDLTALDVAVSATMGAAIGEPGGARAPVDRRLKLKACPEAPEISGPVMGAAVIRCQPLGWAIRVPLLTGAGGPANTARGGAATSAAPAREERDAVSRGQAVRLTVEGHGYSLSRTMIADKDGRIGDLVSVRADRSSKPVLARVTDIGEVTVPGT